MRGLYLALVLLSSLVSGVEWRRRRGRRRALARARLRALPEARADLTPGTEVRVTGVVRAIFGTLKGPMSGRPCVAYRARVGTTRSPLLALRAKSALVGPEFGESAAATRFLLERDGAPPVLIDAEHVELDVPPTPRRALAYDLCEGQRLLHGLPPTATRREELLLEPGARVTVVAFVMLDVDEAPPTGERGFRDGAATRLRLGGSRDRPVVVARASA